MSRAETTALLITGAVLALVSTGALIMLLIGLPLSKWERLLAVLTGAGLQCSLYLLARYRTFPTWSMALVLLLVSVTASTAFMEMAWQRHVTEVSQKQLTIQTDSALVQALVQERNNAQQQIDIRTKVAKTDTSGNYTTKGLERLDAAIPFQNRIREINQQLAQLQQTASGTGADSGSVQALLTGADRFTRLTVFALLAALIDIAALMLWARVDLSVFRKRGEELADPFVIQPESDPLQYLKQRIVQGDFGLEPVSQRQALQEVKDVFCQLVDAGQLQKTTKGFELQTGGL